MSKALRFLFCFALVLSNFLGNEVYAEGEKTSAALQALIDNAQDGLVVIDTDYTLNEVVTIPSDKNITIKDDGNSRKLTLANNAYFSVDGTLTISATADNNLEFYGTQPEANCGSIITINDNGTLNLESGILHGGVIDGSYIGAIVVKNDATLNISGGEIRDTSFIADGSNRFFAPVFVMGGDVNMSGGKITENESQRYGRAGVSGGIMVFNENTDHSSNVTISGGSISNNRGGADGGGMHLYGNVVATMTGGSIDHNAVNRYGGGVYLNTGATFYLQGGEITYNTGSSGVGVMVTQYNTNFQMSGGSVSYNESLSASGFGGGIYVLSPNTSFLGGLIEGNKSGVMGIGGGLSLGTRVYEDGELISTLIKNTVIYNNEATEGGGIWFCSTGTARLYATEGVAVFDNTAYVGDDISIISGSKSFPAVLSERVLGGGEVKYYKDGSYSSSTARYEPQYNPNNPGDPVIFDGTNRGGYALKAIMSDETKALALDSAKLIIRNNISSQGGGIGMNNTLYSGYDEPDEWSFNVKKVWEDIPSDHWQPVKVQLVIGDYELDKIELNSENNWEASFENLPDPDTLGNKEITVKEVDSDNYDVTYSDKTVDPFNKTISISITNKYRITSISGKKTWVGDENHLEDRPDSIEIILLANGEEAAKKEVTADDDWSYTFDGLRYADDDGNKIEYTIQETPVDKYETTYDGYNVTNKYKELINIPVEKVWDDWNDEAEKRPTSVVVSLLESGKETGRTITISEETGWKGVFENIPADGDYSVIEDFVPYYIRISGDKTNGFTITNLSRPWFPYTPDEDYTKLSITKQITGNIDENKEFSFQYKVTGSDGEFYEGSFTLIANETCVIDYITLNSEVTIEEIQANDYIKKYYLNDELVTSNTFVVDDTEHEYSFVVENSLKKTHKNPDTSDHSIMWARYMFTAMMLSILSIILKKRLIKKL